MNLFKKAACFTDLHVGLKGNSDIHNNDCLDYIKWFIQTSKEKGCETCIFMGDFHHHRSTMQIKTMDYAIQIMELLGQNFQKTYFVIGNHDLFFKDKRDIYSTSFGRYIPGITIVDKLTTIGNVSLIPWMVGDEWKQVAKLKSKYVFGHLELPEFYLNAGVVMPDHGQLQLDHFKNQDFVFSGHFHKRQNKGKVWYMGNAFPHNYGDAGDDKRGMMVLEWDGQPEFINWTDAPKYRNVKLSELIDGADSFMKGKMYLRVELDIDISFEEANFIKEKFMQEYDVRELCLIQSYQSVDSAVSDVAEVKCDSVDSIVINELMNVDSDTYDKQTLLDMYNDLQQKE